MKIVKLKRKSKPKKFDLASPPAPANEYSNTPELLTSSTDYNHVLNDPNILPEDMGQIQEPEVVASPRVSELSSLDNATSYVSLISAEKKTKKRKIREKISGYNPKDFISHEVYANMESSTADSQTLSEAESKSPQYDEKISKQALEENNENPIQVMHSDIQSKSSEQSNNTPISSFCEYCSGEHIEIELECSHKYCRECANNIIIKASSGKLLLSELEIKQFRFLCPKCKIPLRKDNYWKIIRPILDSLLSSADSHRWIGCHSCGLVKEVNELYDNLCKECFAFNLRRGIFEHLDVDTQKFINEKGYCDGCENERYFVGDCLTSICPLNHYHCKICLDEILRVGFCLKCRESLSEETKRKIDKILYCTCNICGAKCYKEVFMPKRCCEYDVCAFCQIFYSNVNCSLCNKALPTYALDFLNEVKQKSQND